jgi:hypothetical protein
MSTESFPNNSYCIVACLHSCDLAVCLHITILNFLVRLHSGLKCCIGLCKGSRLPYSRESLLVIGPPLLHTAEEFLLPELSTVWPLLGFMVVPPQLFCYAGMIMVL